MYRYALKVYGCQMNVYDGDKMKTALKERGWTETAEEEADVVILNGCSIRDKAEQKADALENKADQVREQSR